MSAGRIRVVSSTRARGAGSGGIRAALGAVWLECLGEQLPAGGSSRRNIPVRIVVVDIGMKEAQEDQQVAEETEGSEQQQTEVPASARGARLLRRDVGSFTAR